MKRIVIEPLAQIDLNQQYDYIAQDNPEAAETYFASAMRMFNLLLQSPGIGHPRRFKSPHLSGLRSLPVHGFENYLIFYISENERLRIIRVLHGARDIPAILRQQR